MSQYCDLSWGGVRKQFILRVFEDGGGEFGERKASPEMALAAASTIKYQKSEIDLLRQWTSGRFQNTEAVNFFHYE